MQLPVLYDGVRLEAALRLDLLIAKCVIVELKAVESYLPLYDAQLLTYLKLTGHRLGFVINFNVPLIKDGIKRIVLKGCQIFPGCSQGAIPGFFGEKTCAGGCAGAVIRLSAAG